MSQAPNNENEIIKQQKSLIVYLSADKTFHATGV